MWYIWGRPKLFKWTWLWNEFLTLGHSYHSLTFLAIRARCYLMFSLVFTQYPFLPSCFPAEWAPANIGAWNHRIRELFGSEKTSETIRSSVNPALPNPPNTSRVVTLLPVSITPSLNHLIKPVVYFIPHKSNRLSSISFAYFRTLFWHKC